MSPCSHGPLPDAHALGGERRASRDDTAEDEPGEPLAGERGRAGAEAAETHRAGG